MWAGYFRRLVWPLPALLVWLAAWGWYTGLQAWWGWGVAPAVALAALLGVLASLWGDTPWRRLMIALGFPLSWGFATGFAGVPAWWWLLPAVAFLLLYPPKAWKDAPLFPTPPDAFAGLREQVMLPPGADLLDAGCGLGHGLQALERAYPDARLHGIERSWPLRLACGLRCPHAQVRQGDFWAEDWSRYDMVYLFQRPESMAPAMDKAARELAPGAWLASLEFADPDWPATRVWTCPDGRPLYLYQAPLQRPGGTPAEAAQG